MQFPLLLYRLRRNAVPRLRGVCLADVTENDSMDFESNCYAQENDSFSETGDAMEVAAELEIESSCSPDLRQKTVSTDKVYLAVTHAVNNDHDYLHNPGRCIMVAEKMLDQEEEIIRLKKELRKKNQGMSKQKSIIRNLRNELKKLKSAFCQNKEDGLVDPVLLEIQANKLRKRGGARYSDNMKNLALVLQYCSKKAYKQMRQVFALPSISTLRNWLARVDVHEGFSTTVLNLLKIKAKSLPEDEKLVSIFFDEMAITERISYFGNAQPDYFTGFKTRLPGANQVDISSRAKSVLVLMVKSIKSGFKQAIGYFFCHDLKSNDLKTIIDESIKLVFEAGLVPKVLVCDQNSVNRALFLKEYGITEEQPYFNRTVKEKSYRIYCMYDAPHLYKSARNNLLKHNAVYDGQVCSFDDVVKLYWEDIQHTPRTVPNLTYNHINLSQFSEMNVSLAAQTLSWSVAIGIRAYVHTEKLPESSLATAAYCEDFDKLFDCANASNFNSKKVNLNKFNTFSIIYHVFFSS